MDGKWLSVLEYASFKKKSISTVRRYIKANRVKYKEENGKYFIWAKNFKLPIGEDEREDLESKLELERLRKENAYLKEQVSELNMLVSVYESNKIAPKPPEMPSLPTEV